ncbi:MAG: DUF4440 domain-containing protein [Ignavibacteria bacterium]|nr:DUF4440 domain-containing protein [Ignavibacteria bacterium]
MTRRLQLLVLMLLSLTVVRAQSDSELILEVLNNQATAWNRGDIEGYMKGYWNSHETLFLSGGKLTAGYQQVLERFKKSYDTKDKMGKLSFEEVTVRMLSANAALVHGMWVLHRRVDQPWGRFTLIFERKQGDWKITHDHTSSGDE